MKSTFRLEDDAKLSALSIEDLRAWSQGVLAHPTEFHLPSEASIAIQNLAGELMCAIYPPPGDACDAFLLTPEQLYCRARIYQRLIKLLRKDY